MPCEIIAHDCLQAATNFRMFHIHVESPNFIGLHAFYGDAYDALDGWFDRFAERARAEQEDGKPIQIMADVPSGDCIEDAMSVIENLEKSAADMRKQEDETTQAMVDELLEYLGKLRWQLRSMS